ncbi:hypothetical protein B0I37DRAFT_72003 [Chaetomium sp. MPI-CAGE-AT-0009]|nr:hypothetical protein B0I37DRAFT_72003 [Chaetomium sp. MPI-CAGE-AT-0009]
MKAWYPNFAGLDEKSWALKLRPAPSAITITPLHARYMEPSCTAGEGAPAQSRNVRIPGTIDATDDVLGPQVPRTPPESNSPGESKHEEEPDQDLAPANQRLEVRNPHVRRQPVLSLYLPYMNWDSVVEHDTLRRTYGTEFVMGIFKYQPLHPRRTLDQFYYSSLWNTSTRDGDQTVSKWTGTGVEPGGRQRAASGSRLIIVDQLWCWILDEKTVLSFFPSGDLEYKHTSFTPLYESVLESWTLCESAWDLYALLVKEAASFIFRQDNKQQFTDLVETYRWAIGTKAASQTSYFEEYSQSHLAGDSSDSTALDDRRELQLVLDFADIIDELNMIRHLAEKQREVIKSLAMALRTLNPTEESPVSHGGIFFQGNTFTCSGEGRQQTVVNLSHGGTSTEAEVIRTIAQGIKGAASKTIISADETLDLLLAELSVMRKDAEYSHKMLMDLLDLKQKAAALAEARSTTQQGRVIMLFTIVTIIFLPLSFFTSYFGQNVSDITGDDKNPSSRELWQYGAPISVVVILSALLVAYLITKPERLWFCGKRRAARGHAIELARWRR